jgi:hypothetical protein
MGKRKVKGAMTIFFSILTILFLALILSFAESVRFRGAGAKAACVLDLGLFSVFGEYEKILLEEFDVFGVNASAGTGEFGAENLCSRLNGYLRENTDEQERAGIFTGGSLFPMELKESSVTEYELLTDRRGAVFRDQVVKNQKLALGSEIAAGLLEEKQTAEEMKRAGEEYEKKEEKTALELEKAREEAEQLQTEEESGLLPDVVVIEPEGQLPAAQECHPLTVIEGMKRTGILALVMSDPSALSEKELEGDDIPSSRALQEGTMNRRAAKNGWMEEGIFQEYLFRSFSCAVEEEAEGGLSYELEYLLSGKKSDRENLKSVVKKLLLFREGVNFLYVLSDGGMRRSAEALSAALSGGIPGLSAAVTAALLAAWAYGESLIDVRILLSGGKVPTVKSRETFRLTLENLGRLPEVLEESGRVEGKGLDYKSHLRLLYLAGDKEKVPLRALDLIEGRIRKEEGMEAFRADHCVTAMRAEASFQFGSLFSVVPEIFLQAVVPSVQKKINGEISY